MALHDTIEQTLLQDLKFELAHDFSLGVHLTKDIVISAIAQAYDTTHLLWPSTEVYTARGTGWSMTNGHGSTRSGISASITSYPTH